MRLVSFRVKIFMRADRALAGRGGGVGERGESLRCIYTLLGYFSRHRRQMLLRGLGLMSGVYTPCGAASGICRV